MFSVIVSDCHDHDKKAVAAFTLKVMEMIQTKFPTATTVSIWTDGPSSQFKNKFIFSYIIRLIERYNVSVSWNFFATSHGKGPNDALGGNVKRMAHRQALSRRLVVSDADSFATTVNMSTNSILVTVMSQADIDNVLAKLQVEQLWKSIPPMPGIFNTHRVQLIDGNVCCKLYTDSLHNTRVHSLSSTKSAKRKKKQLGHRAQKLNRYFLSNYL